MIRLFKAIALRDIKVSWSGGSTSSMVVAFFIIVVTLFPLGVGPELNMLSRISVGVIWVAALLSCLLSLDRIFLADYEDGTLDQYALSPISMEWIVIAKALAHWVTTSLPLILITPLLGILMNMPDNAYLPLIFTMLVGTPALSLIGTIGASLTVSLKRGGVLLSLLILPLYVPILIFGVMAVDALTIGSGGNATLMILGAATLFSLAITPWAAAAAIRLALD
ncbi:heme exporter protein CcmB [Pseudemcibacter aquimaris]|uniref:heme exporter protein CcmB n=1 Tax=Pseudemcibacter aquimaris TaxID=2857064 RepID=UPI00201159FB|nr:heme exporter protein CcmB [Pseudemcibacter aquimaris]MCC3861947.1 heme exporter protein CcmB [Pseudemcibacter aquimaris]WDU58699.1 heme exporter protein CcmB [Pseudemcibacter aquimaris]